VSETRVCHDCGATLTEWVMENRQVSGGDGVVYAGDWQPRPVHVNRVECLAAKASREATQSYGRECPICRVGIAFSDAVETETMVGHLLTHSPEALAQELNRRARAGRTIIYRQGAPDAT
jgi:hypothetical protein